MNLPKIAPEYTWQIESHLHTEKLNRDEVRVAIVKQPHGLHRRHVVLSKTITLKPAQEREVKVERAAQKLWKKFQKAAYVENSNAYATYLAQENMRQARLESMR